MAHLFPAEFRRRAIAVAKSGQSIVGIALDLDATQAAMYGWIKQDRVKRGEIPGRTFEESEELRRVHRPIRELEAEAEIFRSVRELLGADAVRPRGFIRRSTPFDAGFADEQC